jgi:putative radical SAM enzyme (TIGR03279 family)
MFAVLRADGVLMESSTCMTVKSVAPGSPAARAGIMPGDVVTGIGDGPARDFIDLMYYGDSDRTVFTIRRNDEEKHVRVRMGGDSGIEFEPSPPQVCGNRCVFCFIDQNPKGMRRTIYLKDEDYRYSFLYGSYVTLTALGDVDIERIVEQHLSPLYVSVHATDENARMKLLGLNKPDNLLEKMDRLLDAGIRLHTQIVVCPGINDGAVLEKTICDLREGSENVLSCAVVPVGLTCHRERLFPIFPVTAEGAKDIIRIVSALHDNYRKETGEGFVYSADELYLRAGLPVPSAEYYDDFPQIENGVGMVRQFLDCTVDLEDRLADGAAKTGRFVFVTGMSMAPFIGDIAQRLSLVPGLMVRTVPVANEFYGETVTVSGLLTGGDMLRALKGIDPDETVVLPPDCLNTDGLFLDDLTPDDLSRELGVPVIQGGYDPVELFL